MSENIRDLKDFLSRFPDTYRVDVDWSKDDCGDIVSRSIIVYNEKYDLVDDFITYLE